jgi:hypothetical protein
MVESNTDDSSQAISIELTRDQVRHLDDLCSGRTLSRGELIGHAKSPRRKQRSESGRQGANPRGQVWPD